MQDKTKQNKTKQNTIAEYCAHPLRFRPHFLHTLGIGSTMRVSGALPLTDNTPLANPRWGHGETAKLLIDEGGDVDMKDMFGKTPLDMATAGQHTGLYDMLSRGPRT
jgi:ankyrin repeat protein